MTEFRAVHDSVIPAKEWRALQCRWALTVAVHAHGGRLALTAEDLGRLPLGFLTIEEASDRTIFRYAPTEAGTLLDQDALPVAILCHKNGGRWEVCRNDFEKLPDGRIEAHFYGDNGENILFVFVPTNKPITVEELAG